jgi:hypothetical protein
MCRTSTRCLIILLVLALTGSMELIAREGFGFPRRAATLVCHLPPRVYVVAETAAVVVSDDDSGDENAARMRELVEGQLAGPDSPLRIAREQAQLVIVLTLGDLSFQEDWETRTVSEYRQVGTRLEWSARRGKYVNRPAYGNVPVSKDFKNVRAELIGSYEARTGSGGQSAHRATVRASWDQSYESGVESPSREEIQTRLIEEAARKVAAQLVGSVEPVSVLLPRGSFEGFVVLAEAGEWDRYFAVVKAVPQKRRPLDEAYRQYALGLAHEAMAYRGGDESSVLGHLRTAETHYANATRLNPDESFFEEPVSPLERVRAAIRCHEHFREAKLAASVPSQ